MKNIQIALIIALLLCLLPMPYGYFILIRYLSTIVFAAMAYHYYNKQENTNTLLWGSLALPFQPFFKITLGKGLWNIVDVIVAILLFVALLKESKNH